MIKNIYNRKHNYYIHRYYCDYCLDPIENGKIFRNDKMIQLEYFDLCDHCKDVYLVEHEIVKKEVE